MNELLAAFLASIQGIKNQANAMLAGLPPLEQFEAASDISFGIRSLQRYGADLVENAENLAGQMNDFAAQVNAQAAATAAASAETALLATGGYVKKADAEAALSAAVEEAKRGTRAAITAEQETAARIAAKRAELVTSKLLPAVTAEKLSDALLTGATADADIAKIQTRCGQLGEIGVTAEAAPAIFEELAGIPVTAEGDALFAGRLVTVRQLAAVKPRPNAAINPAAGAGGKGAGEGRSLLRRLI